MKRINVGVVGAGYMGINHLRVYSEMKNCELVGAVDTSSDALKDVKKRFNINTYKNVEEFLKSESIEAVSLSVPTELHHNVAKILITNGINVLVEKPITQNLKEAEELVQLAKKHGVKLMVGHLERFNPMVQRVKEIIDKTNLKDIYYCTTYRLNPEGREKTSAIIDLSTHDIDVLRYLLNSEIVKIDADAVFEDGIERHVVITLDFSCGVKGMINSSLLYPMKKRELIVLGRDILIEGDYITQDISIYRKRGLVESPENPIGAIEYEIIKPRIQKDEPLKLELEHFIDCIVHGKKPLVDGEEGKKTLEIALEIMKKCRSKMRK